MTTKTKATVTSLVLIIVIAIVAIFLNQYDENNSPSKSSESAPTTTPTKVGEPKLNASVVVEGLNNVWEIAFLPDSTMLFTERDGDLSKLVEDKKELITKIPGVYAQGEGGLMGLAVDSDFGTNNYIYVCYNYKSGDTLDIRVTRFELTDSVNEPVNIVTGIPSNDSGRHSGCRVKSEDNGNLWITTGDAADSDNPQSPKSLGGKVLRVDRDGKAIKGNLESPFDPRIFSYGHRNMQGLVLFDSDDVENGVYGFTAEHGPDVDDEINELRKGNFGWDPGSGYDEGVPMTDSSKFPDATKAIWSSGNPTLAVSGMTILKGKQWGTLEGYLAVATLKASHLRIIGVGKLYEREFFTDYGRLRASALDSKGNLYISTSNSDNDKIIKVTAS